MNKTCYVTTPIYYASGEVHIGNSYTTVACDAFARYKRGQGYNTFFLTGMDEHGLKIEDAAKKVGCTPKEYVDNIAYKTKELWNNLRITNDYFIRTTDDNHVQVVQDLFEKLIASDDIYLGEYEGNYCVPCETFFTKTQLNEDGTCPDCGRETIRVKEEAYFLRLKKYQNKLLDFIKSNSDFIQPSTRRNEVISFIESGLEDLCVSRTSLKWGIPVKSNPKHVIYVWIDALANYITALGYGTKEDKNYQTYWQNGDEIIHVVGKDILRFHAIYWPIMLMALNIPIKFKLYVHGWILMKEGKMSKSKGNIVYPMDIVNRYGLDSLRYYLDKEMPLGNDGLFSYERFFERYNLDLANNYGNLVSRTIAMVNKYFNGDIYKPDKAYTEFDVKLETNLKECVNNYKKCFDEFRIQDGIEEVMKLLSFGNKYIDETSPWVLAKDEAKKEELNDVLYHLYEVIRVSTILLSPVLVDSSKVVLEELNTEYDKFTNLEYGLSESCHVTDSPVVLFKRIDALKELKEVGNN